MRSLLGFFIAIFLAFPSDIRGLQLNLRRTNTVEGNIYAPFLVKNVTDFSEIRTLSAARAEILLLRENVNHLVNEFTDVCTPSRTTNILAFNDVYHLRPQFEENPIGGCTRFASIVKDISESLAPKKPLVVFGGDFVGPSLLSSVTKGAHLIEVMNLLGVKYATFGNHEFDYGYKSLLDRLNGIDDDVQFDGVENAEFIDYPESETLWLLANMKEKGSGYPIGRNFTKESVLFEQDDIKIGMFGVSENWLQGCNHLKTSEIIYRDFIAVAREQTAMLKKQGAEVIIALTHNRLSNDRKLSEAVPEIDLILGGHDHFYKYDRKRKVLKAGHEFQWLNHVTIRLSHDGKKEISVSRYDTDDDVEEDPRMVRVVEKYVDIEKRKFNKVVGKSPVDLDARESVIRYGESLLANWICDVVADAMWPKVDVVFLPAYVFSGKRVFKKGPVTLGTVMHIFPKLTQIVIVQLTGQEIIQSLDRGSRSLPGESGALHHVNSRLSYTIDLHKSPRVRRVRLDGYRLSLHKSYKVAIPADMSHGRFGYFWYLSAPRLIDPDEGPQIQDLVLSDLKETPERLANVTMGRITIQGGPSSQDKG